MAQSTLISQQQEGYQGLRLNVEHRQQGDYAESAHPPQPLEKGIHPEDY